MWSAWFIVQKNKSKRWKVADEKEEEEEEREESEGVYPCDMDGILER